MSEKSFIEQLQKNKKKSPRGQGNIAIIACKKDITQGINAGFTFKDIYVLLSSQGRMPISYVGFVKHLRKHISPLTKQKNTKQLQDKSSLPNHVYNPDNYDPDELI